MEQVALVRRSGKKRKINWTGYLWVLPALALAVIFSAYPVFSAFYLSFTNATSTGVGTFIGWQNYVNIFMDTVFWKCMANVVIFTVSGLILGNAMTIFLSELLYNLKSKKANKILRVFFILPILVPSIVIILVWRYIIFSTDGLANALLHFFGLQRQDWYFGLNTAMIAIILTNFPWVGGTSFLIYLAGLQSIPTEVIEASELDGCGAVRRIFKIDLPLIKPQLRYFVIMGVIGGLQNFDLQLIITGSGTGTTNNVNVPGYYLYNIAFLSDKMDFGYASAVGVILFIVTMFFTLLNLYAKKKEA